MKGQVYIGFDSMEPCRPGALKKVTARSSVDAATQSLIVRERRGFWAWVRRVFGLDERFVIESIRLGSSEVLSPTAGIPATAFGLGTGPKVWLAGWRLKAGVQAHITVRNVGRVKARFLGVLVCEEL